MSNTYRKSPVGKQHAKGGMTVNGKSVCRAGFKCWCCQTAPGIERVKERRTIKRADRQAFEKDAANFY